MPFLLIARQLLQITGLLLEVVVAGVAELVALNLEINSLLYL
jgi:hypothetical protein